MEVNNPLYKNIGIHVICSLFTVDRGKVKVLLIKRKNEPFKDMWSLVGGALYNNEKLEEGIRREIFEKTGLSNIDLYFSSIDDNINRSPIKRMVAINYVGVIDAYSAILKDTKKTSNAKWVELGEIEELAYKGATKIYGKQLSNAVKERLNNELKLIIDNNFSGIYLVSQKLVEKSNKDGYIVGIRGSIGSSLVAYCLGITEVDPIKYEIPFEVFAGFNGDKKPDVNLTFAKEYKLRIGTDIPDEIKILESNLSTILHKLQAETGMDPTTISLDDKQTLNIIFSADTIDIPEFETEDVRNIILETKPTNFDDLVKINALSHGTNAWEENAEYLIKDGIATLQEVITSRDDIMIYLMEMGISRETSFDIMEYVRKGKARRNKDILWEEYKTIMTEHNVPEWYIKSCEKIMYLFPKGHCVGYVINAFRIAWYKVHYPEAFYKAYDEVKLNRK